MQIAQQISNAVQLAARQRSTHIAEPWLYGEEAMPATSMPRLEIADDASALELKLSYPEILYAIVSRVPSGRTFGVVGSESEGYEVADLLADNFPNGPILRGYKTVADVVAYLETQAADAGGGYTLETFEQKEQKEVPPEKKPKVETEQQQQPPKQRKRAVGKDAVPGTSKPAPPQ